MSATPSFNGVAVDEWKEFTLEKRWLAESTKSDVESASPETNGLVCPLIFEVWRGALQDSGAHHIESA